MMQKKVAKVGLGKGGPEVARLCLSARMFGNGTEEHEAIEMIASYAQAGGNFVDATGCGADGAAERIVGRALRGDRERWVVATTSDGLAKRNANAEGLSGHWLRQAIDRSRDRLGVKKIDLYYLRLNETMTRLEDTVETLGEMIEAGKIGGWGFANFGAWRIAELVHIADCLDVPRPIAAQSYYHALYRLMEMDYLPACAHFGIGVVGCAPLARGILSGEFTSGIQLPSYAEPQDPVIMEPTFQPAAADAVRAIARHLQPSGRAMTGFALQWVLANQLVSSVLIRPDSLAQLDSQLRTIETSYTPSDEAFMNDLVACGSFIGTGYLNPKAAKSGRVVG